METRPCAGRPRQRLGVEALEARELPAGLITFDAATHAVAVWGTRRSDRVSVSYRLDQVRVALRGGARQAAAFARSQVAEVIFFGRGGSDRLYNATDLPAIQYAGTAGPVELSADERTVLLLTNQRRQAAGLPALAVSPQLTQAAQEHARTMAARDRYGDSDTNGHILDGHDLVYRANAAGYRWSLLAENTGYNLGFPDPAQTLADQWYDSSGHRANLLNPSLTEIGIGVAVGASGRTYGVQLFGRPG